MIIGTCVLLPLPRRPNSTHPISARLTTKELQIAPYDREAAGLCLEKGCCEEIRRNMGCRLQLTEVYGGLANASATQNTYLHPSNLNRLVPFTTFDS